jgi:DNA-binding NtrC family response regulator
MALLRKILNRYNLIGATTAEQAVRLFAEHNRQVDPLITDLTLPICSGIQAAMLLRLENPTLPVIVTSGDPVSAWTAREAVNLEQLGAATVLSKPFRSQEVLNAVRELIESVPPEAVSTA